MAYKQQSPIPIEEGGTNSTVSQINVPNGVMVFTGTRLVPINPGTANQILTSNGPILPPTFQAAPASGISTLNGNSGSATGSTVTLSGAGDVTTSATGSTVTITGSGVTTLHSGSGDATASSNAMTISGSGGVTTSATGSTVTISVSGIGLTWTSVASGTVALASNNGYIINNGASLVTATLPASASVGDIIAIVGKSAGGWLIAQNSGQTIHFGNVNTTTGAGGSLASTLQYDCLEIVCVTTNTDFVVRYSLGNITYV
jgi:hypothetical protein